MARHTSAMTMGTRGGFRGKAFLIMGDQNSDPVDGGSLNDAIGTLLAHPRVDARFVPQSTGAAEAGTAQGGANAGQRGDPRTDTADFNDRVAGNLRVDYLLPSKGLRVCGGRRILAGAGRRGRLARVGRPPAAEFRSSPGVARRQRIRSSMPTGQ